VRHTIVCSRRHSNPLPAIAIEGAPPVAPANRNDRKIAAAGSSYFLETKGLRRGFEPGKTRLYSGKRQHRTSTQITGKASKRPGSISSAVRQLCGIGISPFRIRVRMGFSLSGTNPFDKII
jgi:hypothetical protein